jgi:hypothetical protein
MLQLAAYVSHSVLDEFFIATVDEQIFIFVVVAFIACVAPAISYRFGGFLLCKLFN